MKKNNIRFFILFLLVLLSFYLSVNLWTAGDQTNYGNQKADTQPVTKTTSLVQREPEEVYSPLQLVSHSNQRSYLAKPEEVGSIYSTFIQEVVMRDVAHSEPLTRENYLQELITSSKETYEFVFNDLLPIGNIGDNFVYLSDEMADETFNRIVIQDDGDGDTEVTLYDSVKENVYEININQISFDRLIESVDVQDLGNHPAFSTEVKDNFIYLPSQEVQVSYQDYVVEKLPNSLFINEFFPDTSGVDLRVEDFQTRYIDLTTEVRISHTYDTITYTRQRQDMNQMPQIERFSESFNHMRKLENWKETVKYENYDDIDKVISYQRFIEGVPVFSSNKEESFVEVSVVEQGIRHMKVPMRIIQTPITIEDRDTLRLPPGQAVLDQIQTSSKVETSELDDIQVGLTWKESVESRQLINFNPEWYVKYNGTWYTLDRFIDLTRSGS